MTSDTGQRQSFGFRPLYMQVRDVMMSRLIDGIWKPGSLIPSEIELAREMDVSQGTVRKALDSMTSDNLLVRRQGRGTFVAEMEESTILFQFFRLQTDDLERAGNFPESEVIAVIGRDIAEDEVIRLGGDKDERVWQIDRKRNLSGAPAIVETIVLRQTVFARMSDHQPLPNNLYRLYSDAYGETVARADEKLKAIACTPADAKHLGCSVGTPLLQIERIALGLAGNPLELRVSRCLSEMLHYANTLK